MIHYNSKVIRRSKQKKIIHLVLLKNREQH